MERFVGGLIEHYAGAFPLWLAPEQVRVIPIADDLKGFAQNGCRSLKARGRARAPRRSVGTRSITRSARAEMLKIPYMAVVGKREAEADSIALRVRGAGKKQEIFTVADFAARIEDGARDEGAQALGHASAGSLSLTKSCSSARRVPSDWHSIAPAEVPPAGSMARN